MLLTVPHDTYGELKALYVNFLPLFLIFQYVLRKCDMRPYDLYSCSYNNYIIFNSFLLKYGWFNYRYLRFTAITAYMALEDR